MLGFGDIGRSVVYLYSQKWNDLVLVFWWFQNTKSTFEKFNGDILFQKLLIHGTYSWRQQQCLFLLNLTVESPQLKSIRALRHFEGSVFKQEVIWRLNLPFNIPPAQCQQELILPHAHICLWKLMWLSEWSYYGDWRKEEPGSYIPPAAGLLIIISISYCLNLIVPNTLNTINIQHYLIAACLPGLRSTCFV